MRRLKLNEKLVHDITLALESTDPTSAVKDLMDRAYGLGYGRGREAGIDYIFTHKPEED